MRNDSPQNGVRRPSLFEAVCKWSAVKTLILLNIVIYFGIQSIFDTVDSNQLFLSYDKFADGQIWRLVTYMFCHGNFMHLAFNMFGLYMLGRIVEQHLGKTRFYHLYFLSGILSAALWMMCNDALLIGASGAIFGVIAAAGTIAPNMMIRLLFPPVTMRLKTFVLILVGIELYYKLQQPGDHVAYLVHLFGVAIGFLYIKFLADKDDFSFTKIKNWFTGKKAQSARGKFTFVNDRTNKNVDYDIDTILDKIGESGLQSLTTQEKEALEAARKKLKNN